MTAQEMHERYQIPFSVLAEYEQWNVRARSQSDQGAYTYDDTDLEYVSLILTLHDVGFATRDVERYMRLVVSPVDTRQERMKMLTALRAEAVDEIHVKQQRLDRLDYLRYQIQLQQ